MGVASQQKEHSSHSNRTFHKENRDRSKHSHQQNDSWDTSKEEYLKGNYSKSSPASYIKPSRTKQRSPQRYRDRDSSSDRSDRDWDREREFNEKDSHRSSSFQRVSPSSERNRRERFSKKYEKQSPNQSPAQSPSSKGKEQTSIYTPPISRNSPPSKETSQSVPLYKEMSSKEEKSKLSAEEINCDFKEESYCKEEIANKRAVRASSPPHPKPKIRQRKFKLDGVVSRTFFAIPFDNWRLIQNPTLKKDQGINSKRFSVYGWLVSGEEKIKMEDIEDPRLLNKFDPKITSDLKSVAFKNDGDSRKHPYPRQLLIEGLSPTVSEQILREQFNRFGKLESAAVFFHPETNTHLRVATVTFEDEIVAKTARNHFQKNQFMNSYKIDVQFDPTGQLFNFLNRKHQLL